MSEELNSNIGGRGYGRAYNLIERYIKASTLFNKKYNNYQIDVFLDNCYLNIYFHDLINKQNYHFSIINSKVKDLSVSDILYCYELMILDKENK